MSSVLDLVNFWKSSKCPSNMSMNPSGYKVFVNTTQLYNVPTMIIKEAWTNNDVEEHEVVHKKR